MSAGTNITVRERKTYKTEKKILSDTSVDKTMCEKLMSISQNQKCHPHKKRDPSSIYIFS